MKLRTLKEVAIGLAFTIYVTLMMCAILQWKRNNNDLLVPNADLQKQNEYLNAQLIDCTADHRTLNTYLQYVLMALDNTIDSLNECNAKTAPPTTKPKHKKNPSKEINEGLKAIKWKQ